MMLLLLMMMMMMTMPMPMPMPIPMPMLMPMPMLKMRMSMRMRIMTMLLLRMKMRKIILTMASNAHNTAVMELPGEVLAQDHGSLNSLHRGMIWTYDSIPNSPLSCRVLLHVLHRAELLQKHRAHYIHMIDLQELIMKHSAFVGYPIDLRMEHRKAG